MPSNIKYLQEILKGHEPIFLNESEMQDLFKNISTSWTESQINDPHTKMFYLLGILGIKLEDYIMLESEARYKEIKGKRNILLEMMQSYTDIDRSEEASKLAQECLKWVNAAFAKLEADVLKKQGQEKFTGSDYISAINYCSKALQLDPALVDAYQIRGSALRYLGEIDCAIKDFDQVLTLEPGHAVALQLRGELKHRKEDYEGAIKDFTQAIRSENTPQQTKNILYGIIAFIHGSYLFAVNKLAAEEVPKSDLQMIYLSQAKQAIGEDEGAIRILDQLIKDHPKMQYAYELLTLAMQKQGERKTAACVTGFNTLKSFGNETGWKQDDFPISFKDRKHRISILDALSEHQDGMCRSDIKQHISNTGVKVGKPIENAAKNSIIRRLEDESYIERNAEKTSKASKKGPIYKITHTGKYYLVLLHAKYPSKVSAKRTNEINDSALKNKRVNTKQKKTISDPIPSTPDTAPDFEMANYVCLKTIKGNIYIPEEVEKIERLYSARQTTREGWYYFGHFKYNPSLNANDLSEQQNMLDFENKDSSVAQEMFTDDENLMQVATECKRYGV